MDNDRNTQRRAICLVYLPSSMYPSRASSFVMIVTVYAPFTAHAFLTSSNWVEAALYSGEEETSSSEANAV